ncbi:MAG: hypothetical protein ACI8XM_001870 [Haloarculaceae archaeon]|jgi:hypothetical protein
MAVIGSTLFALLLWGGILAVFGVFVFEAYTVARELGWLDSG